MAALATIDVLKESECAVVGTVARLDPALLVARSEALDAAVLDINIAGG